MSVDVFGTTQVSQARTRYSLDSSVPTRAGGRVGAGIMAGKVDAGTFLVHTDIPGRAEQAMDLGAVASAIVHGAIPYPLLVAAFAAEGKLEDLKKALAAHK